MAGGLSKSGDVLCLLLVVALFCTCCCVVLQDEVRHGWGSSDTGSCPYSGSYTPWRSGGGWDEQWWCRLPVGLLHLKSFHFCWVVQLQTALT